MSILTYMLAIIFLTQFSWAEPALPKNVFNKVSKECSTIFGGDECTDCNPIAPWEEGKCPKNFKKVQTGIPTSCQPFKNERCCSEGHSGAIGACDDLLVNSKTKSCLFLEDRKSCKKLPIGWENKKQCPRSFQWTKDIVYCTD